MSEQSTFEKVKAITVDQLSVAPEDVKMDSTFIDDLGADSLDIVELIMAFEEEFNTEIPDDVAEKIRTVRDAVELLDKADKYSDIPPVARSLFGTFRALSYFLLI